VTVTLAAVLWFITFHLLWSIFWIKISLSAFILAVLSLGLRHREYSQGPVMTRADRSGEFQFDARAVVVGVLSAAALYGLFWLGKLVATAILPFAGDQIGQIYGKGEGVSRWTVMLLLLVVTGPCEEIYWRGFLQRKLMDRLGGPRGWLLASSIYSGVHIWSFNVMLIAAAAVAGLFWGALYWRTGRLAPVILSHSLWSAIVFAVLPIS
jgi:membrane protease YdiL (CAAX protease family)